MMENIVKEFETPQIYPHPVKYIKKIETHCSWVFLTGEYAYKIKKPVNYGFLDFSTADKRKYYTVREYELNRELSPEIYLDVVKIGFKDGKLNLQGEGDILEYALKMKEMPQESIMRNLLQKDMVSLKELHRLIEKIASFHERAETSDEIKREGSLATVKFNWRENFDQTEEFIDVTIDKTTYHRVKQVIENFMESQQELFIKREEEGKIRFCHGDLHSGNIFIYEGIPYIFDRIEFNLRFACSDTVADIAFMLMDLDFMGKKYFADFAAVRYAELMGDYELFKLLDFYMCYRAYVRGKVDSFLYSSTKDEAVQQRAAKYFMLASKYATQLNSEPELYVVCGLPGTGKSTVAELVSGLKSGIHIRSDVERRVIFKLDFDKHYYRGFEQDVYSPEATCMTYRKMHEMADKLLENHKTVILDATYSRRELLDEVIRVATTKNVPIKLLYCKTSDEIARERITAKREAYESDATWAVYQKMKQRFTPPANAIVVDTSGSVDELKEKLRKLL